MSGGIEHLLDRPIAFQRAFVRLGVGVTGALMLSQAVYWSRRTSDADGWFYKTQDEWEEETGLTRSEQETARKRLIDKKVFFEKKKGIPCKLFYRVDFKALISTLTCPQDSGSQVCGNPANKDAEELHAITETTAEITTETTSTSLTAPSAPNVRGTQKSSQIDEQFEAAWKAYPPRSGSRSKVKAKEAWNARRKEGVSTEDMMQGVIRYAAYCTVKGSIGTEYVMQAQRFFGKGREYENDWAASAAPASAGQSRHTGFDQRDYTSGLILREDGTHAF